MGFSVSGAAALIFLALLISFGTFYGAASNSFDEVQEAQDDRTDRALATTNTEIEVVSAVYNTTAETLTVEANNTGAATLDLNATDLFVDGEYARDWRGDATLDGSAGSTVWIPQEQLVVAQNRTETPERIKLVTEYGVADTATVEVVS